MLWQSLLCNFDKTLLTGQQLEPQSSKAIIHYDISNNATIQVAIQMNGGATNLPGYVSTTYEQDMITLDNSADELRAKMPCGHVLSEYHTNDAIIHVHFSK